MSRWNSTRKMWEYGEGGSVSFLGGGVVWVPPLFFFK